MKRYLIPLLLSVAFFVTGLLTLSDYGINWDSPFRFMRGQAFLQFLLTGEKSYHQKETISPVLMGPRENITRFSHHAWEIDTPAKLPQRPQPFLEFKKAQEESGKRSSFYQSNVWDGQFFLNDKGPGAPPLIDILAAASNRLFYQTLGLLSDIESYHLISLFFSAFGVFIVAKFTFDITNSLFASIVSGACLALFPLYFAEAHFNIKDPVQATFFTGAIWSFWNWIAKNQLKWLIFFVVFLLLALAVKWNVIFLPFTILPWLFLIRKTNQFKRWFRIKFLLLSGVISLLLGFVFLTLVWPDSWFTPISRLVNTFAYYIQIGIGERVQPKGFVLPFGFNLYPLLLLLFQTPEFTLLLTFVGVIGSFRKKLPLGTQFLLLFWLLLPILRITAPNIRYYGGIRQIMEVLPVMAILSGIGAEILTKKLKNFQFSIFNFQLIFLFITFVLLLIPIIRLHPYQNVYFNLLIGGLKGAQENNLVDWTLSYGNVYKAGANWLNKNAPKDANLAIVSGTMFALSPLWLRDDISISPYHFSGFDAQGEYLIFRKNTTNPNVFAYHYPERFLKSLYELEVDGVSLLSIYRNDPPSSTVNLASEVTTTDFPLRQSSQGKIPYLEVDLGKDVKVTKIVVSHPTSNCIMQTSRIIDEFIGFIQQKDFYKPVSNDDLYALTERKKLSEDEVEFYFPLEPARFIRVYVLNQSSCFALGKISKITYFP